MMVSYIQSTDVAHRPVALPTPVNYVIRPKIRSYTSVVARTQPGNINEEFEYWTLVAR